MKVPLSPLWLMIILPLELKNLFTFFFIESFLQTFRHGFPHNPTALAFDPVQKLLAIGDKYGSLRM